MAKNTLRFVVTLYGSSAPWSQIETRMGFPVNFLKLLKAYHNPHILSQILTIQFTTMLTLK